MTNSITSKKSKLEDLKTQQVDGGVFHKSVKYAFIKLCKLKHQKVSIKSKTN